MNRPYEGGELELFSAARNWKTYWADKIGPYLGATVLDVGAGLGDNSKYLFGPKQKSWCALEPDAEQAAQILPRMAGFPRVADVKVVAGLLVDLPASEQFDSIIYIDVLEHIEHDKAEMERAVTHLRPGGNIIVLSPANQWLYSEFDKSIAHFRRYSSTTLRACTPPGTTLVTMFHLDVVGLCASIANKLFLHQSLPKPEQIAMWDGKMIPVSRWIDPLIGYSAGKSIIGVWRKNG